MLDEGRKHEETGIVSNSRVPVDRSNRTRGSTDLRPLCSHRRLPGSTLAQHYPGHRSAIDCHHVEERSEDRRMKRDGSWRLEPRRYNRNESPNLACHPPHRYDVTFQNIITTPDCAAERTSRRGLFFSPDAVSS